MPRVTLREGEDLESLIKRFKTSVKKSGNLDDLKRHKFFTKKSIARKEKSKLAMIRDRRFKK